MTDLLSRPTSLAWCKTPSQAKQQLERSGDTFCSVVPFDDGIYLMSSPAQLPIVTPSLLTHVSELNLPNVIAITLLDNTANILVIHDNRVISDVIINLASNDHTELERLKFTFYAIESELSSYTVLTNTEYSSTDNQTTFANAFALAIPGSLSFIKTSLPEGNSTNGNTGQSDPQDTDESTSPLALSITELQHAKAIPELTTNSKVNLKAIAASCLFLAFIALFIFGDNEQTATTQAHNNAPLPVASVSNIEIDIANFYTVDNANLLDILSKVSKHLNQMDTLLGWTAVNVKVSAPGKNFIMAVVVHSQDGTGTVSELNRFASANGLQINVEDNKAIFLANLGFSPALASAAQFHIGSYERLMTQRNWFWWENTTTKFTPTKTTEGPLIIKDIEVMLPNIVPADLNSYGALFEADPFVFSKLELNRDDRFSSWKANIKMQIAGVNDHVKT